MAETQLLITESSIITRFLLPFLFVFFLVYAILEKTKVLGDNRAQLNALLAFVISLIFVGFAYPVMVTNNLILFLTIALVTSFVGILIFSFVNSISGVALRVPQGVIWTLAGVVIFATAIALLWAMDISNQFYDLLFGQSWSATFWTNVLFLVAMGVALAFVLNPFKGGSSGGKPEEKK